MGALCWKAFYYHESLVLKDLWTQRQLVALSHRLSRSDKQQSVLSDKPSFVFQTSLCWFQTSLQESTLLISWQTINFVIHVSTALLIYHKNLMFAEVKLCCPWSCFNKTNIRKNNFNNCKPVLTFEEISKIFLWQCWESQVQMNCKSFILGIVRNQNINLRFWFFSIRNEIYFEGSAVLEPGWFFCRLIQRDLSEQKSEYKFN